jgi:predicted glycogen debranching enzyme
MIALPGLCIETGRLEVARDILTSFAAYVDQGMLPNRFPDRGEAPEYNTVDATLWYFEAIRRYVEAAKDGAMLAKELWPTLADVIAWHVRGTRFGIGVDSSDGLLRAGVPGVQLTWMDARVGDRVITPRIGKPVEINALWIEALRTMERLAALAGQPECEYAERADLASASFRSKFVRADGLGLYDVVGDDGPDPSIRPNQIIAVSLPSCPLSAIEQRSLVRTVEQHLLTPYGLRTLSPRDPAYCAHYGGGVAERDSAYHQGTVWPWLLGPFVAAHLKVFGQPEVARAFLEPVRAHLLEAGIGSISEVFDAEPPFRPNGCIAQAWSVAEVLRAWKLVQA